jgi:glycosyltransferase involved in cell wall biosynthesis
LRLAVVSPFVDRRHGTERALAELLERLAHEYHCEIHLYAHRVQDLSLDTSRPSSRPSNSGAIFWRKVPSVPGPHFFQFVSWMVCNSICRFWDDRVRGLHCELVLSPGINCLDADVVIVHALFHRLLELAREAQPEGLRPNSLRRLHRCAYYALLTRLERRIYTNPNVTLAAVSQRTAVLLGNYFQRQDVAVIPNAVDTTQFSPSPRLALRAESRRRRNLHEQDFVLLLIGNDWRVKGLETVLRATSALPGLPLQLLIVGDESPEPFRQLATHLGVLDRCRFEPSRVDVLDFYAAADLYVSPSLEDSFGLPVAEAMACGLPVITSPRAGVSELIQNSADGFVLRDLRDSNELAGLLEELFRDPDRRQRVGKASARKALEWTWDRHAAAAFQLLQQVLPGKVIRH